ncbi:MAG: major capsid protein [Nitrospirales bacterium]
MKQEMRFTGAGCHELTDAVMRAMLLPGGLTINNLRGPGFRLMQQYTESDGFRALAPLPEHSQKVIDTAVVEVGMDRLTVARDILAMNLTYNLTDPLSITQLEWLASNKVGNSQRTMSPEVRQENFLPDLLANRLPIYLTTSGFELDIRTLRMSQRVGLPLDTANVASGTRAVNESIEDAVINGATTLDGQDLQVAGYKAPGLVNAPNAATQNLTLASWDATPVAATILAETMAMMAKLRANKKFGPYIMYVNTEVGAMMDNDYVTASPQNTIRERLLKLEGLSAIRTADLMPAAKVILVQMTKDVLDIVVGQRPTVIPWTSLSGMTFHNLIMAIMVPRIKWDYNLKSGICIGTIA